VTMSEDTEYLLRHEHELNTLDLLCSGVKPRHLDSQSLMDAQFGLQWAGLVDARLRPTETGRVALALVTTRPFVYDGVAPPRRQ